jgi:hypothetical protein
VIKKPLCFGGVMIAAIGTVVALPASTASAARAPVIVSISSVTERRAIDFPPDPSYGDYYARIGINGTSCNTFTTRLENPPISGVGYAYPATHATPASWTCRIDVPATGAASSGTAMISIELWDHDSCTTEFCAGDQQIDVAPGVPSVREYTIDMRDGSIDGAAILPEGVCTEGEAQVQVCFQPSWLVDEDQDGLPDSWERARGYDTDGDGTIDVELPGADARRKDLYVELDCLFDDPNGNGFQLNDPADHWHCPRRAAIERVVQAFADAPVSNPDGTQGIQLHVDIPLDFYGLLTPTAVAGSGGVIGSYGWFGDANLIPEAGNTVLDWDGAIGQPGTNFFNVKNANFFAPRLGTYRYVIFGHQTNTRAASGDCTSGWAEAIGGNDFIVTLGGTNNTGAACWGTDANGNSVGSLDQQAGTVMHELGHALGLRHGGADDVNSKPNYLSVMNYAFQACGAQPPLLIRALFSRTTGCDFSRWAPPFVPDLNETSLDECIGLGPLIGPVNFDGDLLNGNPQFRGATCQPVSANVSFDLNGDGTSTTLATTNDWNRLVYDFSGLPAAANGVTAPVPDEPDPATIENAEEQVAAAVAPRLVTSLAAPTTLGAGATASVNLAVRNLGSGPAGAVKVDVTKPGGALQTINLGLIPVGGEVHASLTVRAPASTCGTTVRTHAQTRYENAVGDSLHSPPVFAETRVMDASPPAMTFTVSPTTLAQPDHTLRPVKARIDTSDDCDEHPAVRLLSVTSSQPDSGAVPGDRPNDIVQAKIGTDDRRVWLRGEGIGRVYSLTYSSTDDAARVTTKTATVTVVQNRRPAQPRPNSNSK